MDVLLMFFVCFQGEIHRVKSDGTNRTVFAPAVVMGTPTGLALDWISGNLYYTNPATQSIEVNTIPYKNIQSSSIPSELVLLVGKNKI